ncbi:MAG TPA: tetratricopeptide repeat protein [Candidatus Bathyarchaeia archaeon]|nr:tetratricopeptide repeat protein [Candidatus Bathyarchaeia archaeon]
MALLSAALWLRPQASTLQAATSPAPIHLPAPTSLAEAVALSSRGQVAALIQGGLAAARNGETDAAIAAFRRAADLEPGNPYAWTNLGVVLARSGREADGIEAFRRALHAAPNHPDAHRNLAILLDRQGREAEAARHYRAFLSRSAADDPDRVPVAARLGEMTAGKASE